MDRNPTIKRVCVLAAYLAPLVVAAIAEAQQNEVPPQAPARHGEVTGDDVYLRSGPSANHYTLMKVNAGQSVTVVGETGEWYEIHPPSGVFSLISTEYVDTTDERRGRLNADRVRVRAGSSLSDVRDTVQTKLSKGAEVAILGRTADGFYKINPPQGVTVWISRRFVNLVPDGVIRAGGQARTTSAGGPKVAPPEGHATQPGVPSTGTPPAVQAPASEHMTALKSIDENVSAEIQKPVEQRVFAPWIEQYQPIAEQQDDELAKHYATARIGELERMAAQVALVTRLRSIGDRVAATRRRSLTGRSEMPLMLPPVGGFDAKGQMLISALYPEGSSPRRYRLMDVLGARGRTIGYVEIPKGSTVAAEEYVGRYVGVRAAETRLQAGGVNPLPVYIVSDLVALEAESPITVDQGISE